MEANTMKNIVVLKNLPSNLIKEAFVILKDNDRKRIEDFIINKKDNEKIGVNENKDNNSEFIVKEAELLINDYIKDIEKKKTDNKNNIWKDKYKKLKRINIFLILISAIMLIKLFI